MVSPYFLSASSAKTVEKYKAEIDMVRQKRDRKSNYSNAHRRKNCIHDSGVAS